MQRMFTTTVTQPSCQARLTVGLRQWVALCVYWCCVNRSGHTTGSNLLNSICWLHWCTCDKSPNVLYVPFQSEHLSVRLKTQSSVKKYQIPLCVSDLKDAYAECSFINNCSPTLQCWPLTCWHSDLTHWFFMFVIAAPSVCHCGRCSGWFSVWTHLFFYRKIHHNESKLSICCSLFRLNQFNTKVFFKTSAQQWMMVVTMVTVEREKQKFNLRRIKAEALLPLRVSDNLADNGELSRVDILLVVK